MKQCTMRYAMEIDKDTRREDDDGGTWQTNAFCFSQLMHLGQLNPAHLNSVTCLSSKNQCSHDIHQKSSF